MFVQKMFIMAFCVSLCLAISLSHEDMARNFFERVLRSPNPRKLLNSQYDRFEKRQQETKRISEEDCDDSSQILPEYTESVQETRDREMRQLGTQKHYPICHLERKIHKLNTNEYEYRPAYYEEVRCSVSHEEELGETNEICSSLGFSCVQWNKTIHLTRRRYSSDCWETRTLVIPAGCECMWPAHKLGDINLHV